VQRKRVRTAPAGGWRRRALIIGALATGIVLLLAGLEALQRLPAAGECVVTYVYDGDTLEVNDRDRVRLIGVDALDEHKESRLRRQAAQLGLSREAVKFWARRATRRVRSLLLGRQVRLEFGPELHDSYGRTLAYVSFREGAREVMLNELLLREGLAVAYRRFPHPRLEEFVALEAEARASRTGLWAEAAVPAGPLGGQQHR